MKKALPEKKIIPHIEQGSYTYGENCVSRREICLGFTLTENVLFALVLHLDLATEVSGTIQK